VEILSRKWPANLVQKCLKRCAVSVPSAPRLDLGACADALERTENYLYQRHFVAGLMSRYARKQKLFPDRYPQNGSRPVRTVANSTTSSLRRNSAIATPQDYYDHVGAKRVAANVRVPLLMITAQDDPFVTYASFLAARISDNPAIRFVAPEYGGHCGFISKHSGNERFWAEQRIADFLRGNLENQRASPAAFPVTRRTPASESARARPRQ